MAGAWPCARPADAAAGPAAKRQRGCGGRGPWTEQRQHGVSLSDHGGDKVTWSGYWEERERKLQAQVPDAGLYGAVASRLHGEAPRAAGPPLELPAPGVFREPAKGIFRRCRLYFDGRVDVQGGLSAYALGKLARLHGAEVVPRLTMGGTTHVVCTQLSGAKERTALRRAASHASKGQYYVLPEWIAQSVAAGRRLCERRFSVLAQVARDTGVAAPHLLLVASRRGGEGPCESSAPPAAETTSEVTVAKASARQSWTAEAAAVVVDDSPVATDVDEEASATELDDSEEE